MKKQNNKQAVAIIEAAQPIAEPAMVKVEWPIDGLTTSVQTWNSSDTTPITLNDPNRCVTARFEYIEKPMNETSKWKMLHCSDNGMEVGVPFKDSYSVLNMAGFNGLVESLLTVLENNGIKPYIATTGTLNERGRIFISIGMEGADKLKVGTREFLTFLNLLNSVDKSCTVTFSNNTFCVCCKNTFAKVLHNVDGSKFNGHIKHTKGMKAMLADVPKMLEAYITGNDKMLTQLKAFDCFPVTLTEAESIFAAYISDGVLFERDGTLKFVAGKELSTRSANIVEAMKVLFAKGKGNKGETALDLFSGLTEYYTHVSAGKTDDANKQFTSSEIGDGAKSKEGFYDLLSKAIQSTTNWQGCARVGDTLLVAYRSKAKG